jgi:hypothetical protein
MQTLTRILLAGWLLLAFTSASRSQEKTASSPWFPLKPGTTWQYRVGDNKFELRVPRIEKGNPRIELVVKGKVLSNEEVQVTDSAVTRLTFEGKAIKPAITLLKLPPMKGQSWPIEATIADGQVIKGTLSTDEKDIEVPAGQFKAIVVTGKDLSVNGEKLNISWYFANDVGMVKQELELAGKKVVIELEKYIPGKD